MNGPASTAQINQKTTLGIGTDEHSWHDEASWSPRNECGGLFSFRRGDCETRDVPYWIRRPRILNNPAQYVPCITYFVYYRPRHYGAAAGKRIGAALRDNSRDPSCW